MSYEVRPCTGCGTTGGYISPNMVKPIRHNGARTGEPGELFCHNCHNRRDRLVNPGRYVGRKWRVKAAKAPLNLSLEVERRGVEARLAIIRAEKIRRAERGVFVAPTPQELDAVLRHGGISAC